MREPRVALLLTGLALTIAMMPMAVVGTGCGGVDSAGNVYWNGSYLGHITELSFAAQLLILHDVTVHVGPVSHPSAVSPAQGSAANYCFLAADEVDGPEGTPEELFLKGTFVARGNTVTAQVGQQGGDYGVMTLQGEGDTLTGPLRLTVNGVTYQGTLAVERAVYE